MRRDEDANGALFDANFNLPLELARIVVAMSPAPVGAKRDALTLTRLEVRQGRIPLLGLNVGNSMWHSGTLAAAKQAALLGHRNVNFPMQPRGVRWTRQSVRQYDGRVFPTSDPLGRDHYWLSPVALEAAEEGTDRRAVEDDFVSITPLRLDLTDHGALGRVLSAAAAE